MEIEKARWLAARMVRVLEPFCERVSVAGSVRRGCPDVGDIEIVCMPKLVPEPDLFGVGVPRVRDPAFVDACTCLGHVRKGMVQTGKYIQFWQGAFEIQVDLFTAVPENWGLILAIRTGSSDFSHNVLASGWVRAGYHSDEGLLRRNGAVVPVREEEELFKLIGIPWVPPEGRQ